MAMVRDPAFWRRFSVAVHLDEEAAQRSELKHSYVTPLPSPLSSPCTSTVSARKSPIIVATTPLEFNKEMEVEIEIQSEPASPTISYKSNRTPSTHSKHLPEHHPSPPRSPPTAFFPCPKSPPNSHSHPIRHLHNPSTLTLGLSGRPPSAFKFWTIVTADGSHRESWLEQQRKKKSKRTCMCWIFWLVFMGLVAGIVIVVLWLKGRGVI
ncbi:uncharacterized protein BDR25DRAFT_372351 [Lindgomyces ingoldianus]|uniref:Uncharacterized protein n=1 Tax=Lindgomyces ingoldianus TaxID=673940 RepID=A0ACB6QSK4_9PLEO|nr:uncharacterized protein BDR25DRAFT_372351 [Lindgomyces ingoldianus]KAF2469161.1 hypothetical protein BDR25DRAFT_372351 [Lindgomyces ingoldianus]